MTKLDFHIDTPPIHNASIEAKMDFNKVISDVHKTKQITYTLFSAWTLAIICCFILVIGFGLFNSSTISSSKGTMHAIAANQAESTPSIEDTKLKQANTNLVTVEEELSTNATDEKYMRPIENNSYEMSVELKPQENKIVPSAATIDDKQAAFAPVPLRSARMVPIKRERKDKQKDLRIAQNLNINVDLTTYASLKNKSNYYFELDPDLTRDVELVIDSEWENAELKHHPRKDRYKMILRNGKKRREIVVRLVVNDLKMHDRGNRKLFARIKARL